MITLRGVTWKHDRGLAPMVATARRFAEDRPDIRIEWEARSLHEFGEASVKAFAESYDLIVLDHPFMGAVAQDRCLVALDEYIPQASLDTLESESVGVSHQSYFYGGHQWALAIDAAAQVAGYRPDLLDAVRARVPNTWDEVFELAKIRPGFVSGALFPLDSLMCFFTLCANAGHPPFLGDANRVVDHAAGEFALVRLRELAKNSTEDAVTANPIAVWERMSTTNDIAYCPLAFGYSNYARNGYRPSLLSFTNIPSSGVAGCGGATLGGAGIAISKGCSDIESAVQYVSWVAGADCQRKLYVQSGGQPGNKRAWIDSEANSLTNGFFESTLPTLQNAFLRPRVAGFPEFQNAAFGVVWRFLNDNGSPRLTLDTLNDLYRRMLTTNVR
ncbi:MAG: ABC transporter substrate-binding protein [Bryobacteraceae bacterium]